MKPRNAFLAFFISILIFALSQNASAQFKFTINDKREIIQLILQKQDFDEALNYVPDGTLFISTENIPVKIQKNFPKIKGVKFKFITPEYIDKATVKVNYFAFTKFKTRKKSVEVSFIEYNLPSMDGRSFICRKINGKWKIKASKIIIGMS